MKRKNTGLFVIIFILISLNVWVALRDSASDRLSFDPEKFSVADTSEIVRIQITSDQNDISLLKNGKWILNDTLGVDMGILRFFLSLQQNVRIIRELSASEKTAILENGKELARVTVSKSDGSVLEYVVFTNPTNTSTYFFDDQSGYKIGIPGYAREVGSFFELRKDQWRDRIIFDGNWRTIQSIDLIYQDRSENISISFSEDFFRVEGLNALDSNAVVEFLNQFELLQANERISRGQFREYDSLSRTSPFLTIIIDDIKFDGLDTIRIYSLLPGDKVRLVLDPNNEMTVFENERVLPLLKKKEELSF